MKLFLLSLILFGIIGCTNQLQFLGEPTASYFRDSLSNEPFDSTKPYYYNSTHDSTYSGPVNLRSHLWIHWKNGTKSYKVSRQGLPIIFHASVTYYDSLGKKNKHVVYRKKVINNWRINKKQKFYTSGRLDSIKYINKKGVLKRIKYRNH